MSDCPAKEAERCHQIGWLGWFGWSSHVIRCLRCLMHRYLRNYANLAAVERRCPPGDDSVCLCSLGLCHFWSLLDCQLWFTCFPVRMMTNLKLHDFHHHHHYNSKHLSHLYWTKLQIYYCCRPSVFIRRVTLAEKTVFLHLASIFLQSIQEDLSLFSFVWVISMALRACNSKSHFQW